MSYFTIKEKCKNKNSNSNLYADSYNKIKTFPIDNQSNNNNYVVYSNDDFFEKQLFEDNLYTNNKENITNSINNNNINEQFEYPNKNNCLNNESNHIKNTTSNAVYSNILNCSLTTSTKIGSNYTNYNNSKIFNCSYSSNNNSPKDCNNNKYINNNVCYYNLNEIKSNNSNKNVIETKYCNDNNNNIEIEEIHYNCLDIEDLFSKGDDDNINKSNNYSKSDVNNTVAKHFTLNNNNNNNICITNKNYTNNENDCKTLINDSENVKSNVSNIKRLLNDEFLESASINSLNIKSNLSSKNKLSESIVFGDVAKNTITNNNCIELVKNSRSESYSLSDVKFNIDSNKNLNNSINITDSIKNKEIKNQTNINTKSMKTNAESCKNTSFQHNYSDVTTTTSSNHKKSSNHTFNNYNQFSSKKHLNFNEYPSVGVGIAIIHNEKLLLGRRIDSAMYGLPGGWIEYGEEWEECASRELLEETNIYIPPEKFSHIYTINSYQLDKNYHAASCVMLAEMDENEVKNLINKEPTKCYGWFWTSINDMRHMNSLLFYPLKEFICKNSFIKKASDLKKLVKNKKNIISINSVKLNNHTINNSYNERQLDGNCNVFDKYNSSINYKDFLNKTINENLTTKAINIDDLFDNSSTSDNILC